MQINIENELEITVALDRSDYRAAALESAGYQQYALAWEIPVYGLSIVICWVAEQRIGAIAIIAVALLRYLGPRLFIAVMAGKLPTAMFAPTTYGLGPAGVAVQTAAGTVALVPWASMDRLALTQRFWQFEGAGGQSRTWIPRRELTREQDAAIEATVRRLSPKTKIIGVAVTSKI